MTVDRSELFNGGTNGAALTTANTAFDAITIDGTAAGTFDATTPIEGTLSFKAVTGGSTRVMGEWQGSWTRRGVGVKLRRTANPTVSLFPLALLASNLAVIFRVKINTDGTVSALDSAGTVLGTTTGVPISLTGVSRIEALADTTTHDWGVKLWVGANVDGTTPSASLAGNSATITGTIAKVDVGVTTQNNSGTTWFDVAQMGTDYPSVTVNTAPTAPTITTSGTGITATTTDLVVPAGAALTFTAAATDPENNPLTYHWQLVSAAWLGNVPAGQPLPNVTLSAATGSSITATMPRDVYEAKVVLSAWANDGQLDGPITNRTVTVAAGPWIAKRTDIGWVRKKVFRRVAGAWAWP